MKDTRIAKKDLHPKQCPICLEDIKFELGYLKECQHSFHHTCIRNWHIFAPDLKCPVCRSLSKTLCIQYFNDLTNIPSECSEIDLTKGFQLKKYLDVTDDIQQYPTVLDIYDNVNLNFDIINIESGSRNGNEETQSDIPTIENSLTNLDITSSSEDENTLDYFFLSRNRISERYLDIDGNANNRINRLIECTICGTEEYPLDILCEACNLLYHETCLHSLATEVNEPDKWDGCIECQQSLVSTLTSMNRIHSDLTDTEQTENTVDVSNEITDQGYIDISSTYDDNEVNDFQLTTTINNPTIKTLSLDEIKENKQKIQTHTRKVLNTYYQKEINGRKLSKLEFTNINKKVSRELYKISCNEYKIGIIDYEKIANMEIRTELRKLNFNLT